MILSMRADRDQAVVDCSQPWLIYDAVAVSARRLTQLSTDYENSDRDIPFVKFGQRVVNEALPTIVGRDEDIVVIGCQRRRLSRAKRLGQAQKALHLMRESRALVSRHLMVKEPNDAWFQRKSEKLQGEAQSFIECEKDHSDGDLYEL
jgi:hypothetical protein